MSWPNTAQRRGWTANSEDAGRYGNGHRPYPRLIGGHWFAGCACRCDRGEDGIQHPTWDLAYDASCVNLTAAEHGPSAGQETP